MDSFESKYVYEHDKSGKIIAALEYSNGKLTRQVDATYDSNGSYSQRQMFRDGKLNAKCTFNYGNKKVDIKEIEYKDSDNLENNSIIELKGEISDETLQKILLNLYPVK